MPTVKLAAAAGVAALVVCACGSAVKPPQGHGKVDDPRTYNPNHVTCLRQAHLPVQEVARTGLQIGALPAGPSVWFEPTPGAAQAAQIDGASQAAEVIGSALVYPHQAPDGELTLIENCLSNGVSG
jgi:hypothetical protein